MPSTWKKAVDIFDNLLSIGMSTARDLQRATDLAASNQIKKAIKEGNLRKLKRVVGRGGILVDRTDILGIGEENGIPFIKVTPAFIIKYRWMFNAIKRFKRTKGA